MRIQTTAQKYPAGGRFDHAAGLRRAGRVLGRQSRHESTALVELPRLVSELVRVELLVRARQLRVHALLVRLGVGVREALPRVGFADVRGVLLEQLELLGSLRVAGAPVVDAGVAAALLVLADARLAANSTSAEATGSFTNVIDFMSNGFKLRNTDSAWNRSGGTYIFMCYAENPFVTSTGIPATAR